MLKVQTYTKFPLLSYMFLKTKQIIQINTEKKPKYTWSKLEWKTEIFTL